MTQVMTFGKYKGLPVSQVPARYLLWAHRTVKWFTLDDETLAKCEAEFKHTRFSTLGQVLEDEEFWPDPYDYGQFDLWGDEF